LGKILQLRRRSLLKVRRGMGANLTESALNRQRSFGLMTKVLGAMQRLQHGIRACVVAKSFAEPVPQAT
jgi:hypothetical protein